MAKREDGKETRRKLLHTACEVFSHKGYRKSTVASICQKAGANQAAVNYYFGDKAKLYAESWQYAVEQFGETVFSRQEDCSPREQLRTYIHSLMKNIIDKGIKGAFSRLYMMELVNPTGLIQDTWYDVTQPRRQALHNIIFRIMGRRPGQKTIVFCELSIVSQCRALLTINPDDMEYFLGQPLDQDLITRMADHITDFSLAGIEAVGIISG